MKTESNQLDTNRVIRVLPPEVTEKIAAGEVIERPASVIKELVENSLDAGSTRIDIRIEEGGFRRIRVADNGSGMSPADLQTSLMRHATSKITDVDDLYRLATFGFRGEALASISAVSRLSIASSATTDGLGFSLASEGGGAGSLQPCSHTRGTTIDCRELFFNVPARRKFMKSVRSESMAIVRLIEQLCIAAPGVHFILTVDGVTALDTPAAESVLVRIGQVAGNDFAAGLIRCTAQRHGMETTVYICQPGQARSRPRFQLLYVNLRRIDSDSVAFAIREAFGRFIDSNLRPSWFCFLEIDPEHVDVNVHPTKQRIKFDDERAVFSFLHAAISDGVQGSISAELPRVASRYAAPAAPVRGAGEGNSLLREHSGPSSWSPPTAFNGPAGPAAEGDDGQARSDESNSAADGVQTTLSFFSIVSRGDKKELEAPLDSNVQLAEEQWDLIPCYQIHKAYILASIKNGILIIDQHAAHERILYEQALEDLQMRRADSQRLLFPVVLEFSTLEKAVVMGGRELFSAVGFDLQDFGPNAVAVNATPAAGFVRELNIEEAVRDMVNYLMDETDPAMLSEPHRRFAAAFACGSAIKVGKSLRPEEMNALLNNLFTCENPYTCPHGRPTFVRISLDELSRRFLR